MYSVSLFGEILSPAMEATWPMPDYPSQAGMEKKGGPSQGIALELRPSTQMLEETGGP